MLIGVWRASFVIEHSLYTWAWYITIRFGIKSQQDACKHSLMNDIKSLNKSLRRWWSVTFIFYVRKIYIVTLIYKHSGSIFSRKLGFWQTEILAISLNLSIIICNVPTDKNLKIRYAMLKTIKITSVKISCAELHAGQTVAVRSSRFSDVNYMTILLLA